MPGFSLQIHSMHDTVIHESHHLMSPRDFSQYVERPLDTSRLLPHVSVFSYFACSLSTYSCGYVLRSILASTARRTVVITPVPITTIQVGTAPLRS